MKDQSEVIKDFLMKNITEHPVDIVAVTAKRFAVTRTTVHRHLNKLIAQGVIIKSGMTRDVSYVNSNSFQRKLTYKITSGLSESDIYQHDFETVFSGLNRNVQDIISYGFTEIFNNAIDHSDDNKITVETSFDNGVITLSISDNGIGVFKKLYEYFRLDDLKEGILQLNKGKMTTDPTNHSGEGIFFSARAFDIFEIEANGLRYIRDNLENDWAVEAFDTRTFGSRVIMKMRQNSHTSLLDVFKKYQDTDDMAFDRTEITVELSKFGDERLMSRSQAKRICRGLEKFKRVTLDFSKVRLVGQGFVDEIFRVYANAHPGVSFSYINANEEVEFMIKRGLHS